MRVSVCTPRCGPYIVDMRFLGVGNSCDLGDMYLRLLAKGHEVRVFASELSEHGTMVGMLPFVSDYRTQLDWIREAGADGFIVFETAEHGAEQDALRADGFFVIGGCAYGDKLENDRGFGQRALAEIGLATVATRHFTEFDTALRFLREQPGRYVFKLDGSEAGSWRNYVGQAADGADMIALLNSQQHRLERAGLRNQSFLLMDYVEGVEVGVGAYFDGEQFMTPACIDWEHKRFFVGDLGELTGEMGTLVSYRDSAPLFDKTLARLAPALRDAGYVGYINLNTIVNERGIFPLELTCRFGYPGFAILDALQLDGWDDLFCALRDKRGSFRTADGFAIGVVLTVPPYPYRHGYAEISRGLPVSFSPSLSAQERAHLHFGEVAMDEGQLVTSGVIGYTMVTTGTGLTVEEAQQHAYALARQVHVPNLRYRTDIGDAYLRSHRSALQRLGLLHQA